MAFSTFSPTPDNNPNHHHHSRTPSRTPKRNTSTTTKTSHKKKKPQPPNNPSSWNQIKSLLTCKPVENSKVHDPSSKNNTNIHGGYSKLSSSCSSICNFRDVVHGNTRVVHRADNSPENSSVGQETGLLSRKSSSVIGTSSNRSTTSSIRTTSSSTPLHRFSNNGSCSNSTTTTTTTSRGMQLRKLSGCYECHMIVDPSRRPITPRTTICVCKECGEIFPKIESLEHHQAIKHAVSELGPEDSGRNIVEIIFKSSWLKKDVPICKIERILKVHNTQRTIQRFEDCRDSVKIRATSNTTTRKNARCAADGNELLRFHCTSLTCSLGAHSSTSLCGSVPGCGVCTIIRHGFPGKVNDMKGVCTTATSGRAHDSFGCTAAGGGGGGVNGGNRRAMLVCRVIAGRVKRIADDATPQEEDNNNNVMAGSYDSVAGYAGIYANLEELIVFNPKAILPCFVVIYTSQ
ncbi:hypothetical protein MKW94_010707 [Papaver nudicaule]|uniref:C2H2-type domain-containing protein n=1 Tax=Papaver nudicaule TaxID=74823 RepID=A0AA41RSY6_PAPNU|nr:hypothetical protein [Papaver nudicaule]